MTRGRLVLSFLLFVALCASIAYWVLQLYDPPLRPVAASTQQEFAAPRMEAAAAVFGGQASSAPTASNFQLRGVIVSGTPRDSVAIIAVEGKPPLAVRANTEVMPGVTVQEVHPYYVLLSDGGALKRVELPAAARNGDQGPGMAARSPVNAQPASPSSAPSQMAAPAQPIQSAPAPRTTVVTPEQQEPPQDSAAQQDAQAGTENESSAPSAEVTESGDEQPDGPESTEAADPTEMQANPPRR